MSGASGNPADRLERLAHLMAAEAAGLRQSLEPRRRRALQRGGLALLGLLLVYAYAWLDDSPQDLRPLVLGGTLVTLVYWWHLGGAYAPKAYLALAPIAARAIGGMTHQSGHEALPLERAREIGLIAPWNAAHIDGVFAGRWRETGFLLAAAHLTYNYSEGIGAERKRRVRTIFQGLIFVIEAPMPAATLVLIRGRSRLWTNWRVAESKLPGLVRVKLPHAAFERRLAMWAADPEAAPAVVGPGLADTLAYLAAMAGRRGIDAALDGSRLLLLVPGRSDPFGFATVLRPADKLMREAKRVMREALTAHRVIDVLIDGAPRRGADDQKP